MTTQSFKIFLPYWTHPVQWQWDTTQRSFTTTSIEGKTKMKVTFIKPLMASGYSCRSLGCPGWVTKGGSCDACGAMDYS